ncbi:MAG: hypothetical protein AB7P49_00005 [Bdellovibrionales bacterium]
MSSNLKMVVVGEGSIGKTVLMVSFNHPEKPGAQSDVIYDINNHYQFPTDSLLEKTTAGRHRRRKMKEKKPLLHGEGIHTKNANGHPEYTVINDHSKPTKRS